MFSLGPTIKLIFFQQISNNVLGVDLETEFTFFISEENSGKYLLVANLQMVICHSSLLVKIFPVPSRQVGPILFLVCRNSSSLKVFSRLPRVVSGIPVTLVSFHRTISPFLPPLGPVRLNGARAGHMKPGKANPSLIPLAPRIDSEMADHLFITGDRMRP